MASQHSDAQIHQSAVDYEKLLTIGEDLLRAIGEDPTRAGLVDTPKRFASFWREFIEYETGNADTIFDAITDDQMVIVTGIKVWSLCEHHLMPFWVDLNIGCMIRDSVLGLSKFARIAHKYAHRLQLQERIVSQIADEIRLVTGSPDVAVFGSGVHLCMVMRGIKTEGTMKSSVMHGRSRTEPALRQEFLSLIETP
jgi:GTP cyclohydrolase I